MNRLLPGTQADPRGTSSEDQDRSRSQPRICFPSDLVANSGADQFARTTLVFKWIRILYRRWQNHTPYREAAYLTNLPRRSPIPPTTVENRVENDHRLFQNRSYLLTLDLPGQMSPAHFTPRFM
jgi:hypothetical protein